MNFDFSKPIRLVTSRAWRTYEGGKMISALHGETAEDSHFPEEWLMSMICARNVGREDIVEGISRVANTDMTLYDLVTAAPKEMLGEDHVKAHGATTGVLVKLLDSAERLGIQVHPDRTMAKKLFNSEFGKTECWYIIGRREIDGQKPCIYMGFREGVTREMWKDCFDKQDIPLMLSYLHRFEVEEGDTFIVRGGVPHAIGCGCFLVEIQEPTDYTIRSERVTPKGLHMADAACHQGLGFERMFDCFSYEGKSHEETDELYHVKPIVEQDENAKVTHVVYPGVTDMFSMDVVEVEKEYRLEGGRFCGLYVLAGQGDMGGEPVATCDHFFVPAACEGVTIKREGNQPLRLIRCFGPEQWDCRI